MLEEKSELIKNFDRFEKLKHSSVLPKAFTEKDLYMLATIIELNFAVLKFKHTLKKEAEED